ncbi:MAG: hypothetical protein ACLQJR_14835 [Stellaceae bacterium]
MGNAIEVTDSLSNSPEQIEIAAKTLGRNKARRAVFDAIYHHKSQIKTVGKIAQVTRLKRMRVLQEGRHLAQKGLVRQTKKDGDTAYEKIGFFHAHKRQILALAANPRKLAKLPTKRMVVVALPRTVSIPSTGAMVRRITIDDIETFARVKKLRISGSLPASLSEKRFKLGIQAIIGEPGEFKDWPGEKSDLYSTRVKINGRRLAAAFAFKGPGEKRKLVPGRMGKNGDQMPRLFQEEADIFFVQHWREIDPSVIDLMRNLAIAKSVTTGKRIFYGVIDGQDSERLRLAYASKF